MHILITGGSGFIGHNLIFRLIKEGHRLTVLDRYEAPFLRELGVRFVQGDFSDRVVLDACMGMNCDTVIHMACSMLPRESNQHPYEDVVSNVGGTVRLLEAAVKNEVRRFIFLSSGGTVYGDPQYVPIDEKHPTNPDCSYGISKVSIEKYLRLFSRECGLSCCSVRLANPYGVYQRFHAAQGVIPVFCYRAMRGEPLEIWGDGSVKRDFVYISDVAEALCRLTETPGLTGEINIGSGEAVSLNDLLGNIEYLLGRPLDVRYRTSRSFDVPVNVLDITRAGKELGWVPTVPLRKGLQLTMQWIRSAMAEEERYANG